LPQIPRVPAVSVHCSRGSVKVRVQPWRRLTRKLIRAPPGFKTSTNRFVRHGAFGRSASRALPRSEHQFGQF
jgi:hypothetical protein